MKKGGRKRGSERVMREDGGREKGGRDGREGGMVIGREGGTKVGRVGRREGGRKVGRDGDRELRREAVKRRNCLHNSFTGELSKFDQGSFLSVLFRVNF